MAIPSIKYEISQYDLLMVFVSTYLDVSMKNALVMKV